MYIKDLKLDTRRCLEYKLEPTEKSKVRQLDVGKVRQQNDKHKCNSINKAITVQMYSVNNKVHWDK